MSAVSSILILANPTVLCFTNYLVLTLQYLE